MPFDFAPGFETQDVGSWSKPASVRKSRGAMAHYRGVSAEEQVARHYANRGAVIVKKRWRGRSGEIDLIFRMGDDIVFVEVKAGQTHQSAAEKLRPRQMERIMGAAEEFLGTLPNGSLTPMRLDVALVDGVGQIEVIENALMAA